MGKSFGRKCYDAYDMLPDGVKCHMDKVIRGGAKVTKGIRNRKAIQRHGENSVRGLRKRLRV